MEHGAAVFKGADMAENFLQHLANLKGILTHPIGTVGIGAHGDDLTAQFPEPLHHIPGVE